MIQASNIDSSNYAKQINVILPIIQTKGLSVLVNIWG